MSLTVEEKYSFLCSKMQITNPDFWEGDALVEMKPLYFQLEGGWTSPTGGFELPESIDKAIELAIIDSKI